MGWPSGTVTFLFTDIEGSTRLWDSHPEAMQAALERHDALVRAAIDAHGGTVFATGGDGFSAVFSRVKEALAAAIEGQAALAAEEWPEAAPIRVRMALHTGEAVERGGDYFGTSVNETARLMALGHGGQVLCSAPTALLLRGEPLVDLGTHRLRDLSAPQQVFQVGSERFAPLRAPDAVPTNLPAVTTKLIGREDDVSGIVGLLDGRRLLTLTGVGGVGKTRLALAAAARAAKAFVDGCWFVDLSSASTDADVPRAAASALQAAVSDEQALVAHLSQRRLLLILDNCEHVLDGAASLVEALLARAPDVVTVATSREPLGVDGELVYRVPVLDLPDVDDPPEVAARSSAVRLFVERSALATEPFEITSVNAAAVVSICRHLDGLPLAIELAAARARSMSVSDVERLLGERFRVLRAESRRGQARHRTLLATLEWSHDLLGGEERRVLRRLSVFPSKFDLRAAEAVCAEDGLDVVDALVRLVDRSLVAFEPTEGRHRLLETVRHFATERLEELGETAGIKNAHADYYRALAATTSEAAGFRASVEMDNLRVAVEWLDHEERWGDLIRLCGDLTIPLNGSVELFAWFQRAVEQAEEIDQQERVDALGRLAYTGIMALSGFGADYANESVALAESADLLQSPWAWCALAMAPMFADDYAAGRKWIEPGIEAADLRQDVQAGCLIRGILATFLANAGEIEACEELAIEALRRGTSAGDPYSIAVSVITAVSAFLVNRDTPTFEEGLELLRSHPVDAEAIAPGLALWIDFMWGVAYLGQSPPDQSVHYLTRCLVTADRVGTFTPLNQASRLLALAHARAGRLAVATQILAYADAKLSAYPSFGNLLSRWTAAEVASALAAFDPDERSAAVKTGAALERAAFIRLISDAGTLSVAESAA